jgi:hypothetical protein
MEPDSFNWEDHNMILQFMRTSIYLGRPRLGYCQNWLTFAMGYLMKPYQVAMVATLYEVNIDPRNVALL